MKIASTLTSLIGNTPMLALNRFSSYYSLYSPIIAKLEYFNPGGSVKDRVGYEMIINAENNGTLKPGGTIIEPTSGNTGVGLALTAATRGYKLILTMPETMSVERRKLLAALGANIVLTPGDKGMQGAIDEANHLREITPGAVILQQFDNQANPRAHYHTTGPEIWRDTQGAIDIFIACAGTGGTISGVTRFLKEKNPDIIAITVEPTSSPVLSGGKAGVHGIQGIGAGFIPSIFDTSLIDEVITITDNEAYQASRLLAKTEGLLVGISSGAAAAAAVKIAGRFDSEKKNIVTLFPDTGERYLSTPLFDY